MEDIWAPYLEEASWAYLVGRIYSFVGLVGTLAVTMGSAAESVVEKPLAEWGAGASRRRSAPVEEPDAGPEPSKLADVLEDLRDLGVDGGIVYWLKDWRRQF